MKIEEMEIRNFRGIKGLSLRFNGQDALITGRNGAGKTTIVDAYTWLFTGKMSNGKTAEVNNGLKPTYVGLKFVSGNTFEREYDGKVNKCWIGGKPLNLRSFQAGLERALHGALLVLTTPFDFSRLHWKERRKVLMGLAEKVTVEQVIATDERLNALMGRLKKISVEDLIEVAREKIKTLKKEQQGIPDRIEEITGGLPIEVRDEAEVRGELKAIEGEMREIEERSRNRYERRHAQELKIVKYKTTQDSLKRTVSVYKVQIDTLKQRLKQLRQSYASLNEARQGKCPVCGGNIPVRNQAEIETKIADVIESGKSTSEKIETLESAIDVAYRKSVELESDIVTLEKEKEPVNEAENQHYSELKLKRADLLTEVASLKETARKRERAAALHEREREIGNELGVLERDVFLGETYIKARIGLVEESISRHFEHVKFRMFEDYKVSEGVKEMCEPEINGIGYGLLSRGERFKASIDIVRALQRHYHVELPVFIDDAESYTSNSLLELPNQKIWLKAAEGELKMETEG